MTNFNYFILVVAFCIAGVCSNENCKTLFELKYSDDCREKVQCVWGKPSEKIKCPDSLIFNADGVCDHPKNVLADCKITRTIDNPCRSDPCQNGGSCLNLEDGKNYLCVCPSDFYGNLCQNNTNGSPCDVNPCQNGGICNDWEYRNLYSCSCRWGYTGKSCETYLGQCHNNPCNNGGLCRVSDDSTSFSCVCPEHFEGAFCEKELSIIERCQKNPSLLIPHRNCHQFYNCSLIYNVVPWNLEQHLEECPYPEQFSVETYSCKNFTEVSCGNRTVMKNGCNYSRNMCRFSHCIPCYVDLPSCEGYTNGLHEHGYKTNSPWYMICYNERTVYTGMCPYDTKSRTRLFPVNGTCGIRYT